MGKKQTASDPIADHIPQIIADAYRRGFDSMVAAKRMGVWFTVPGKPAGKARPRFNRKTGVVYSPDAGNFQARVAHEAVAAGLTPTEGPVDVWVLVLRQLPKSYSKKRCATLLNQLAGGKPDAANIQAAVHDALEGIAYHNDSQVAESLFIRRWTDQGDSTMIFVSQLGE